MCLHRDRLQTNTTAWSLSASSHILSSPSVGADGLLYVGSFDHNVCGLNTTDGSIKLVFGTGSTTGASPCFSTDGSLYTGSWS